jgi:hypothetical protein
LAIPLFSQIDGICYDLTSKKLFTLGLSKSGGTSEWND